MSTTLTLPDLPFYWRTKATSANRAGDLPQRLPFTFAFERSLGLLIEQRSADLSRILKDMYRREANVGFLQDGHSLAKGYGEDFWRFLSSVLAEHGVRNILEIGCGGCIMLERLKEEGYAVIGIDPSPVARDAGRRKQIEVIQDFFPSPQLSMTPDMIFHVDVLEHAEDPVGTMRQQHDSLRAGALVVVNVPDSTASIEMGDISLAMHQHVNMFTAASLSRTIERAGFEMLRVERSRFGASLYALARKPAAVHRAASEPISTEEFARFIARANRNIRAFQRAVQAALAAGESIGFFMPMRAFPYLATMGLWHGFRLFDNMNAWHRRYFDGVDQIVENQEDLFADPVDHVFIMSLTFGDEVRSAIVKGASRVITTTLKDIVLASDPREQ